MNQFWSILVSIKNLIALLADIFILRWFLKVEKVKKPREVFTESCHQIAEAFEADGFKFVKSRMHMYRKTGKFREEIFFQSSRYNERGVIIQLTVHVHIYQIKEGKLSLLASFDIGDLCNPQTEFYWNLAFNNRRKRIIAKVIKLLRERAIPHLIEIAESRIDEVKEKQARATRQPN